MLKLNKIAIALALLGMTSVASAQVYEMSFVDSNNATVVKAITHLVQPNGFRLSDRNLWAGPQDQAGIAQGTTVVETQTSALITLANRIVASDGKEFYGIKFSLSTPAEGNYIPALHRARHKGVVVTSTDYTFNVDTSGPTTTNSFVFSNSSGTGGSMNVFGLTRRVTPSPSVGSPMPAGLNLRPTTPSMPVVPGVRRRRHSVRHRRLSGT